MAYKLLSLFDGSGGFPLAGSLCGIVPVAASEVEPYPIAVTRSRFPGMKHLGDISKINGAEIEPVNVITFGSPCQDLSVAGKRAGIKHEASGDEETTRSGLFMEAVRIIKEMRRATNGIYPNVVLWENVPGAFSSNGGEDFRTVLDELIKIVEPNAVMPPVPKAGWAYADSYSGDGWSLAYRVFDAQYWGVPQRRRRIHLVLHLTGGCARAILFERQGLRGHFTEGGTPGQGTSAYAQNCLGTDDHPRANCLIADEWDRLPSKNLYDLAKAGCARAAERVGAVGLDCYNQSLAGSKSKGMTAAATDSDHVPCVCIPINTMVATRYGKDDGRTTFGVGEDGDPQFTISAAHCHAVCYAMQAFGKYTESEIASAMKARDYKDATDLIIEPIVGVTSGVQFTGRFSAKAETLRARDYKEPQMVCYGVDCRNMNEYPELYPTLQSKPNGGQSLNFSGAVRIRYIARRLTPTECQRLQGFADAWGVPDQKDSFSDEEYRFWLEVRNTHAQINGKAVKEYTREQMLKWYNKLHTDSSEYKMWGNGIALPPALYCMQGIVDALEEGNK